MQIVINQAEIETAIRSHIQSKLSDKYGASIDIDLAATRGPKGFTATITVTDDVNAPKPPTTPYPQPVTAPVEPEKSEEVTETVTAQVEPETDPVVPATLGKPLTEEDKADFDSMHEEPVKASEPVTADLGTETKDEVAAEPTPVKRNLFAGMKPVKV